MAFVNGLWLAYTVVRLAKVTTVRLTKVNLPSSAVKRYSILMLRIVQFMNGVRPSNKWPVRQWVYSYCTNCHARALFVNGHRLHVATVAMVTFVNGT